MNQQYDRDFALPLSFKIRSRDGQELDFHIRVLARLEDAELFEESFAVAPSELKIPVISAFFSDHGDLKKIARQEFSAYTAGQLIDDSESVAHIAQKLKLGFTSVFSENGLKLVNIERVSSKPEELDVQLREPTKLDQAGAGKKATGFPRWALIVAPIVVIAIVLVILNGVTGIFSPKRPIATTSPTTTTTQPVATDETPITTPFTPPPLATGALTIRLVPGGYTPLDLTILAGSSVLFENPDDVEITLISDYPFNQKIISRGSAKLTFDKTGTFKYYIESQPDYKGIITVI